MTYPKGGERGTPACLKQLRYAERGETWDVDIRAELRRFIQDGNAHFLPLQGPSITVGDLHWEWRILQCGIFSREKAGSVEELIAAAPADTKFPLWVTQKYYHNMAVAAHATAIAEFTATELREWVEFFELHPGDWKDARATFKL